MSNHPTRRRLRALALATAGLTAAGITLAPTQSQAAERTPGTSKSAPPSLDKTKYAMDDGLYIVVLNQPGSTGYAGGVKGIPATRATGDRPFASHSDAARRYSNYLRSEQNQLAQSVGASIDRHYTTAANGFGARLTGEQAMALSTNKDVALVEKSRTYTVDTWNTPEFLGLSGKNGVWNTKFGGAKKAGDGVVVGVIDTGIWPESKSFKGRPLGESPDGTWDLSMDADGYTQMDKIDGTRFYGQCQTGEEFELSDCNSKLVSAKSYGDGFFSDGSTPIPQDYLSPRDSGGHGTHTASTAAGRKVANVTTEGVSFGTVRGMAPGAKIAAYKALWGVLEDDGVTVSGSGTTYDLVAAIDDATYDGVDVINYSISGALDTVVSADELFFEGATEAGIFISASAGNSGPDASTVAHNSPWITTVAATTSYNFENTFVLGNGRKLVGASSSTTGLPKTTLVYSGDIPAEGVSPGDAALCQLDTIDPAQAAGKIVLCDRGVNARVQKSEVVAAAGGVGMVLMNVDPGTSLDADFHEVPTVHVTSQARDTIMAYLEAKGAAAVGSIRLGNLTDTTTPLPQIAGFSSRGPALASDADVMKPDIGAPGVSILAAVNPETNSGRDYDLYSGTSMAAPHIAGLAALLASEHASWTPMMIKSAMMTTASPLKDSEGNAATDLSEAGAGQVVPSKFFKPGLFVTSDAQDWRAFYAGQGLVLENWNDFAEPMAAMDLNVPSMSKGQMAGPTTFTRTFTSQMKGTWKVKVKVPGFTSSVSTSAITADRVNDLEDLTVTFTRDDAELGVMSYGHVVLTGPTTVKIPVALRPVSAATPGDVYGEGTAGSTPVEITGGFNGDLEIEASGMYHADSFDDSVAVNDYNLYGLYEVTEAGKGLVVDVGSYDQGADIDLYVYEYYQGGLYGPVGQSASASGEETVELLGLAAGTYIVDVEGYSAGSSGDPIDFWADVYTLEEGDKVGTFDADPNPVPIESNVETTFDAVWSGLDINGSYLGLLDYTGTLAPTKLRVYTWE